MYENHWIPMADALSAANASRDPRTKCGVVIVTRYGRITTCNAFPLGVTETDDRWQRPLKYAYVEHAERSAIYEAARVGASLWRATIYSTVAPCVECARAIISAGIQRVVHLPLEGGITHGKWVGSIAIANELMKEAGVDVIILEEENVST